MKLNSVLHQRSVEQLLKKYYVFSRDKAWEKTYNKLIVHSYTHDLVLPQGQASYPLGLLQILRLPGG